MDGVGVGGRKAHTGTVVVGIEQGKEGANGKDIVVLGEASHGEGWQLQAGSVWKWREDASRRKSTAGLAGGGTSGGACVAAVYIVKVVKVDTCRYVRRCGGGLLCSQPLTPKRAPRPRRGTISPAGAGRAAADDY